MTLPFKTSSGHPLPFGASISGTCVNFSLFSRHAEKVYLLIYKAGEDKPCQEIKLSSITNRSGEVWHVMVHDLPQGHLYAYRLDGPNDPQNTGHSFDPSTILLDPFAKALSGGEQWGSGNKSKHWRGCIVKDDFDWQGDKPLNLPLKDSIIYELHVRGFTMHSSSQATSPGTYLGLLEKIPYLKKLGITAVELMPITEFDENENTNINPETGESLKNYWGYSPIAFFAPKASYASDGKSGNQVNEFKTMVRELHKAGIEVILDMVFNHTAEGNIQGPTLSFRGIDNTIYYLLDRNTREYLNFSGCGNTFNCNHPLVRNFIMDCLRYWVLEMHVDGFRFDLASILGRDQNGEVLSNPPMVEQIAEDPLLANTKIIAEAWDAAGLYQVGNFSTHTRWAEWNGRFRDDVRSFLCSHPNSTAKLATRIGGSSDLYQTSDRSPCNSINFITSHDGFTLQDLVSYNQKHNLANGEDNRDGENNNISWNSGKEGLSKSKVVQCLRQKRIRSLAVILFLSQGTPMLVAGDEFGRTQLGNNNAYCQDSSLNWLDWNLTEKNAGMVRFFEMMISLRKKHPVFRRANFFADPTNQEKKEIVWQSLKRGKEDWSDQCKTLCFLLNGGLLKDDNDFFIMLNGHTKARTIEIPKPPNNNKWKKIIDTARQSPYDIITQNDAAQLKSDTISVAGMGAVVLIS